MGQSREGTKSWCFCFLFLSFVIIVLKSKFAQFGEIRDNSKFQMYIVRKRKTAWSSNAAFPHMGTGDHLYQNHPGIYYKFSPPGHPLTLLGFNSRTGIFYKLPLNIRRCIPYLSLRTWAWRFCQLKLPEWQYTWSQAVAGSGRESDSENGKLVI